MMRVISIVAVVGTVALADSPDEPDTGPQCMDELEQPRALDLVDIDRDGDLDVFVAAGSLDRLGFYINDGSGAFGAFQPLTLQADFPSDAQLVDLDGDGDVDVVAASLYDNEVAIYRNDGAGAFAGPEVIACGAHGAVAMLQLDEDAELEAAVTMEQPGDGGGGGFGASVDLQVFDWDGADWTPVFIPNDLEWLEDLASADIDGDGDEDLVAKGINDGRIGWYPNDGGALGAFTTLGAWPGSAVEMQVVDVDGDGDVDIVASAWERSALLSNDGAGGFTQTELGEVISTDVVDMDGDGDLDLLVGGVPASWRERTADGLGPAHALPSALGLLAAGDLDGDGDVDVVGFWEQLSMVRRDGPDRWSDPVSLSVELCDDEIEDDVGWRNEDTEGCAPGESDAIGAGPGDDAEEGADGCGCASARPAAPAGFALLVVVGLARRRDTVAGPRRS